MINTEKMLERFLAYVAFDTMSDDTTSACPSTEKQWAIARYLEKELTELGMQKVKLDACGFVTAMLPATAGVKGPSVGFMAHYDTIPGFSGTNVKARVIRNYDGGDIYLGDASGLTTEVARFPELARYKGCDLVVSDGTTLLGGDNKCGVADIMAACQYFIENPGVPHCEFHIAFTPDEETGMGIANFDVDGWECDFAYTVDGSGGDGLLAYETFNAAKAAVKITGVATHTGSAKNALVNAIKIFGELMAMLPEAEAPEYTAGYEGFYHAANIKATVELVNAGMILRDHNKAKLEEKKRVLLAAADYLNLKYGEKRVDIAITDQYQNMYEILKDRPEIMDAAKAVMLELGITPRVEPIRGGTDGAQITFRGCPTPNFFSGEMNAHGPHEGAIVQSMEKAAEVVIGLAQYFAK